MNSFWQGVRKAEKRGESAVSAKSKFASRLGAAALGLLILLMAGNSPPAAAQEEPVSFAADDSLVIHFDDTTGDTGQLFGNARVEYRDISLTAWSIGIQFELEELSAFGLATDSGLVGQPEFVQGAETLRGAEIAYNMSTERGRIVTARTQFEEGFIQAGVAKMREDSTIFIRDGLYTTCNCADDETPSYSLRASKMKVVDQKRVYTGPIQLYIYNIPMPIWLPFGFLPYQEGRRSGLLAPEYGEDQRGFYLRNWGWYWALNDYTDLQLRLGIWTKGSWQVYPTFRYNSRDRFSGMVSVDFLRERSGERHDPDLFIRNNMSFRWTHNQTINPRERLTANVNLTSSSYLKTVSTQYNDNVRQSVGSSIQYNRQFRSRRSLSVNVRQNQILSTGNTDLTLPELSFSQSTRAPFKRDGGSRDERWYERLQYSVSSRLSNRFNYRPLTDQQLIARGDTLADGRPVDYAWYEALFDGEKYAAITGKEDSRLAFTATHRVPVSAPFSINRIPLLGQIRLNLSPNLNYSEAWFINTERQAIDSVGAVQRQSATGFFSLRQFDTGVSANTTIYGLFPVKIGAYEGLRHTVRPRVGFSYRPDFAGESWGYTRALVDADGIPVVDTLASGAINPRRYNIVTGVRSGRQQAINFGIDNTFETKHVQTDSVGNVDRHVLRLITINVSSSYNFAADSLRLAPVRISARTNVLGKVNINVSSTWSPYGLSSDKSRIIDDYVFSLDRFSFARLTNLSIRGDMRLRGQMRLGTAPAEPVMTPFGQGMPPSTSMQGMGMPFSPNSGAGGLEEWSMNLSFSYQISRPLARLNRSATVNTGFNFSLTPTWRVRGQTGYDIERKKLVTTTLNLSKEFECWNMAFTWIPFGNYQSWGFDLHVKSGRLSEFLRIRQPKAERDRRFGL